MASSEKTRVVVYLVFFVALIALAIFYRPQNAMSRPAEQNQAVLGEK